jgi:hypothetical protein
MQISMKYIIFSLLLGIGLIIPQNSFAQTADAACSGRRNGDDCKFVGTSGGRGSSTSTTRSGFCDRNGDGKLYCNSDDPKGWSDCFPQSQEGDACIGGTGGGRGGTARELGTCSKITSSGGPRSSGTTTFTCDTTKKPPGNPGGFSPNTGASSGGGTCQDCGGSKCNTGQVCTTIGGKKECVPDSGTNNVCGINACNTGQVCATIGGKKECISNQCTGGGGAGNGGGGTTTPGNETPTDATAPQSVGFVNPIRFNSIPELIAGIINALLGVLGAITVAILVMSGFKYMTASNPGAVGQALDGITNAIVGLIIIMGAFLITQYVITALAG